MMSYPIMWLALGGAILGFALMLWGGWLLTRRWPSLTPRWRWAWLAVIALFEAAYWLNIYAWFIEPEMLVVRRVEIISPNWNGAPITIAAIGDTHVPGPHMSVARMGRIVTRVNRLRPDLVVLLGDYVGGRPPESARTPAQQSEVLAGVATFAAFSAPLGVVAILGNHDVWYGRTSITRALEEAGVAALWDRNVVISRPGGDVVIAGLADDVTDDPSFANAIDGAPPNTDTIVLSHTPDEYADVPAGPALMLAGHTHCGQVTIPLLGRPILPVWHPHYACHRIDEDGKIIYITAGIGTSFLPVRFLNPPEITLIRLRGPNSIDLQSPGIVQG